MSEQLKAFRELSKEKPPNPEMDYNLFTFEMGEMVGELVKSGKITREEAFEVAAELSKMNGTVQALMERIWPHEL